MDATPSTDQEENEWCDCRGGADEDPFGHLVSDHKYDCYTPPPCGGCERCLTMQFAYYKSLEEKENGT